MLMSSLAPLEATLGITVPTLIAHLKNAKAHKIFCLLSIENVSERNHIVKIILKGAVHTKTKICRKCPPTEAMYEFVSSSDFGEM